MVSRRVGLKIVTAAAAFALSVPIRAAVAADFPTRPITLVVPYGPGSGSDLIGRVIAKYLSTEIGQSVIVQNRPGATGAIGTEDVIHASPDGYTLVVGTNATIITAPILYPNMSYSPDVDLVPVGMIGRGAMVLVTRTAQPAPQTMKDLIAELRAKPMTYGGNGVGTNGDVISRIFLKDIGATGTLVTYKGSGDSMVGLIQGDTAFVVDTPTAVLPLVKSGQLRPIATTGKDRLSYLPDMPTFTELGVPGLGNVYAWYGIFAPANTPPDVVKILSQKLAVTVQQKAVQDRLSFIGVNAIAMQDDQFKTFVDGDVKTFGGFIRSTGIKLNK